MASVVKPFATVIQQKGKEEESKKGNNQSEYKI
jgi:hypothetical protein